MKKHHEILVQLYKVLDSFKPQQPAFYTYIEEIIEAEFYPDDKILYEQGEVIKRIFYLASGTVVAYNFTETGEKQILHIFRETDLITGQSFTLQTPGAYYLMVCAGSYMLHMTYKQLNLVYRKFPETEELARLILSSREEKEIKHRQILILPGIQMVEAFYKDYPELIEPGKVLRDRDIATYLLLAESTLRGLRNDLFRSGKLEIPIKSKT
jgi:CRP-like cAMP-binding protein